MSTTQVQGYDPKSGRAIGEPHPDSTAAEIEAVLVAAAGARQRAADATVEERVRWLTALRDAVTDKAAELVELADSETGLGRPRLESELERTTVQIDLFVSVLRDGAFLDVTIDPPAPDARPAPRPDIRKVQRAVGPVAVWAASNFPFAFGVLGGDTISALAAGCPAAVKSHPSQPALSRLVGSIAQAALEAAGAPGGLLGVLHGDEAGLELITDPRIKAGAFTGSTAGGRALFDLANKRPDPIPFFAEMGSVNPVFVTRAAALARGEEIADGCIASVLLGAGQFCTKPGAVFVPAGSGLASMISDRAPAKTTVPMLNSRMYEGFSAGAARVFAAAGVEPPADSGDAADGYWPAPAVVVVDGEVFGRRWDVLAEECFGPLVVVVEYADDAQLEKLAARFTGCLTATIHGEPDDVADMQGLVSTLVDRAGRIVWNGWPTGVAVTWAMEHGGPYPATTAAATTSVGAGAIARFLRPVAYQGMPQALLPEPLRDDAFDGPRRINGCFVAPPS